MRIIFVGITFAAVMLCPVMRRNDVLYFSSVKRTHFQIFDRLINAFASIFIHAKFASAVHVESQWPLCCFHTHIYIDTNAASGPHSYCNKFVQLGIGDRSCRLKAKQVNT